MTTAIADRHANGIVRKTVTGPPEKTAVDKAAEALLAAQEKASGEEKAKVERAAGAARKALEEAAAFDPASPNQKPVQSKMIPRDRFAPVGQIRNEHVITVESLQDYAAMLCQPWRFRLIAQHGNLRVRDKIEVQDDNATFYAELLVTSADRHSGDVIVREILFRELPPTEVEGQERGGFTPVWGGLHRRWTIVRDDGHEMARGIASRDEAMHRIRVEFIPTAPATHILR